MSFDSQEHDKKPKADTYRLCGQCGKQAIGNIEGAFLCVDCFYKLEVAKTLAVRLQVMHLNFAADSMDSATGLRGFTPKMQVPDLPKAPPILHHIKIDNSVVGAVNTGTVQSIDVAITYLENSGNTQVSSALTTVTQTIASNTDLSPAEKKDLLEQVAYLSEQAALGAKDRKPGMVKAVFEAITQGSKAVTAVSAAWGAVAPFLKAHFGFGS